MKKLLLYLLVMFGCNQTLAQINLVKNPSFEQYTHCPNTLGEIAYSNYLNGIDSNWIPGDTAGRTTILPYLPEFVNTCGTNGDVSVPNNYDFHHYPRTGNGMVQQQMFYDYYWGLSVGVDYLQGHLYHPLVAGQTYCVTFYVVLEGYTGFAINHISAYLDNGIIDTTTRMMRYQTEYTPQVVGTTVIYDTINWTKIQGSFIANGTETFITIGVFTDTGATTYVHYVNPGLPVALYLVDDVSVIASDAHANAGADVSITAGDSTYIGIDSNGEGMPCYWYTLGEPIAIDSGGRILVHPAGTTTYIVEMDLCGTITRDTVTVHVWSVGVNPTLQEEFLHVYPNPTKDNFVIEGAMGCEMKIYNVVGQEMFEQKITTSKEEININSLTKGIYIVEISEPETGMKVSKRIIKS